MTENFPVPEIRINHRVSYGETDCMGVVYYAEYLHFFERARNEYIRALGMPYTRVEERGLYLPVREASCRYRRPARYDNLLEIRAGIDRWGKASLNFVYEIYDQERELLLAQGATQHACVNKEGRPVPAPDWFVGLLKKS